MRLFVPPASLHDGQLDLARADAARLHARGAHTGALVVALDDSGWEYVVALDAVGPLMAHGQVVARRLAAERRTKITLYQALLHPSDFRRLLTRATELGVVAFTPIIADGSVVPVLDAQGRPEGDDEWPRLVRDAAEASSRGRQPTVAPLTLLDHALDEATRNGHVLLPAAGGQDLDTTLADRPFTLAVFCPPPGGFTADEVARAQARGVALVAPLTGGPDPIRPGLKLLEAIYARLEAYDG
jgi:16S rRNA (uracil1498-N3)-methyltransferase